MPALHLCVHKNPFTYERAAGAGALVSVLSDLVRNKSTCESNTSALGFLLSCEVDCLFEK